MEFVGVIPPSPVRPAYPASSPMGFIKDSFSTSTLLLIGAAIQLSLLAILPFRLAATPIVALLFFRTLTTILVATKTIRNPYMDGVIRGKVSAQLPSTSTGRYGGTPASSAVTVFLLGMQVNHPLGLLAPGTREIGEHFAQMQADMEAHGDEYGLLGSSSWRADQERDTMNQFLTVYYFKDVEGISKFAHGPVHRAAWDYYNKAKLTHIGFMHEMFSVPRSAYESLYLNCRPNLMGLLRVQVRSEEKGGREEWMSPLVKANKGALRSSFGRLGRSEGKELEQYGEEPAWHESRYRE